MRIKTEVKYINCEKGFKKREDLVKINNNH